MYPRQVRVYPGKLVLCARLGGRLGFYFVGLSVRYAGTLLPWLALLLLILFDHLRRKHLGPPRFRLSRSGYQRTPERLVVPGYAVRAVFYAFPLVVSLKLDIKVLRGSMYSSARVTAHGGMPRKYHHTRHGRKCPRLACKYQTGTTGAGYKIQDMKSCSLLDSAGSVKRPRWLSLVKPTRAQVAIPDNSGRRRSRSVGSSRPKN